MTIKFSEENGRTHKKCVLQFLLSVSQGFSCCLSLLKHHFFGSFFKTNILELIDKGDLFLLYLQKHLTRIIHESRFEIPAV